MKRPYTDLPGLSDVYLEDSFVLAVEATPGLLRFTLDVVLTPSHRQYSEPKQDEQNCYARGALLFSEVSHLTWTGQGVPLAVDASGEIDYGGVDLFEWDGAEYRLAGGWGYIDVEAKRVRLELV
jgi:hypothetical protein